MNLLAATDLSTRSYRALLRAAQLAEAAEAQLTLLHVVDDDQPARLVELERREAEQLLAQQVGALDESLGARCRPMVATGDPFDAILQTAAAQDADLIVMGTHRKQLLRDIFVGTTIERVIRSGPYPVLMVNNEACAPYRTVLAPVDLSEPSANAIRVARATVLTDRTSVTVLHAFSSLGKGRMITAGVERTSIEQYVAGEREKTSENLAAFLAASGVGDPAWSRRVEESDAFQLISRVAEETKPDLVVLGTRGHSWLSRALIGSVTEEALRSLKSDILAVPPPARRRLPDILAVPPPARG